MDALNLLPIHPRWGQAIGLRRNGAPIWPYRGASEPDGDDSAQSGADGDGTTGQGAGTASGSTTDQASTSDGQGAETDDDGKVSREDFLKLQRQLSAADKAREDAQKKLQEIADAEKGELQKATERAEAAEKRVRDLEKALQDKAIEQAMLTDPEWGADKWHDAEDVLVRLNRAVSDEQGEVMKDGQVDRTFIKKFLKDLSAKKPYLLKTSAGSGAGGKSGANVGGGDRRNASGEATDDDIRKKYRIR